MKFNGPLRWFPVGSYAIAACTFFMTLGTIYFSDHIAMRNMADQWVYVLICTISVSIAFLIRSNLYNISFIGRFERSDISHLANLAVLSIITQIAAFSLIYKITGLIDTSGDQHTPVTKMEDFVYFSVITMTTVGYGDIVPATHLSRLAAGIEAFSGYFVLATFVALIIAIGVRSSELMRSTFSQNASPQQE